MATNLLIGQVSITFTLGNSTITIDGVSTYYEFDIIATPTGNSQFKLAQVYINYNVAGIGSSIYTAGNVTVTTDVILNSTFQGIPLNFGAGIYTITLNNNTPSKLSTAKDFGYLVFGTYIGVGYELSNLLGTIAKVYARVKIKTQNPNEYSGISLDNTVNQFDHQQFYYTIPGTNNQANYSPVNVGSGLNELLPVELTFFTSKYLNDKVQLNWETKTEVNNYSFDVERALSLSNQEKIWEKIGFVNGNGNSNSPKQYSFTDKNPIGGNDFVHRLKQIDTDGKYEYSDEIEVELLPSQYGLYQNYPNPFNPTTMIKFSLPEASQVSIKVFDILGGFLLELTNTEYEAGYHKVDFDASTFPSGVYLYRLECNNYSNIMKML